MTTGARIKEARKAAGMTQAELANRLGVSQAMVAQYESDSRKPKHKTLQKIAEALETSVFSLMEFDETELSSFVQNLDQTLLSLIKADYSTDTEFYKDFFGKKISLAVINSETDRRLVTAYYKLNEEGKQKAVESVEIIAGNPHYQKPKALK